MLFNITKARGDGICGLCNKFIDRGEPQILIQGYRCSARVHLKCMINMIADYMMLRKKYNDIDTAEGLVYEDIEDDILKLYNLLNK